MADNIVRFKPITSEDVFKGLDKTYSSFQTVYGTGLTWYQVDRTATTWSALADDMKNLFHSFGIAREDQDDWYKIFNIVDLYNAKRMIIATIPQSSCGTLIDGATLEWNVPLKGTGATDYVTFYGASYNGYPFASDGRMVSTEWDLGPHGSSTVYLFANTAGSGALAAGMFPSGAVHPYTGSVAGASNPNSGLTSWNYSSTDSTKVPHLKATHPDKSADGNDKPYGIAFLEKGIFVLFDYYGRTDLIGNSAMGTGSTIWQTLSTGAFVACSGTTAAPIRNTNNDMRKGIFFTGTTAQTTASLTFRTVTNEYKTIYFCHAGQGEFNSTSNHTYDHQVGYFRPNEASSVWITEIGLYDDSMVLLAYAKLSEPVEKNKLETLTFKVELKL